MFSHFLPPSVIPVDIYTVFKLVAPPNSGFQGMGKKCQHWQLEEQMGELSLKDKLQVYWVESLRHMSVHLGMLPVAFLGWYKVHMAEMQGGSRITE